MHTCGLERFGWPVDFWSLGTNSAELTGCRDSYLESLGVRVCMQHMIMGLSMVNLNEQVEVPAI